MKGEAPRLWPEGTRTPRSWLASAGLSIAVVAVMVVASVFLNPLLGRVVHWRRIDIGAPIATLVFALAFRRRWL